MFNETVKKQTLVVTIVDFTARKLCMKKLSSSSGFLTGGIGLNVLQLRLASTIYTENKLRHPKNSSAMSVEPLMFKIDTTHE